MIVTHTSTNNFNKRLLNIQVKTQSMKVRYLCQSEPFTSDIDSTKNLKNEIFSF